MFYPDPSQTESLVENFPPEALFDRQLVWIAFGLMLIGLDGDIRFLPTSSRLTDQPFHFMFPRHAIFLLLAIVTSSMVLQVPLERWMKYSSLLLAISFFAGCCAGGG